MKNLKYTILFSFLFLLIGLFSGSYIVKKRINDADFRVVIKNQAEGVLIINHRSITDGRIYHTEKKPVGVSWQLDNRGKRNIFGSSCEHHHFDEVFTQSLNF